MYGTCCLLPALAQADHHQSGPLHQGSALRVTSDMPQPQSSHRFLVNSHVICPFFSFTNLLVSDLTFNQFPCIDFPPVTDPQLTPTLPQSPSSRFLATCYTLVFIVHPGLRCRRFAVVFAWWVDPSWMAISSVAGTLGQSAAALMTTQGPQHHIPLPIPAYSPLSTTPIPGQGWCFQLLAGLISVAQKSQGCCPCSRGIKKSPPLFRFDILHPGSHRTLLSPSVHLLLSSSFPPTTYKEKVITNRKANSKFVSPSMYAGLPWVLLFSPMSGFDKTDDIYVFQKLQ